MLIIIIGILYLLSWVKNDLFVGELSIIMFLIIFCLILFLYFCRFFVGLCDVCNIMLKFFFLVLVVMVCKILEKNGLFVVVLVEWVEIIIMVLKFEEVSVWVSLFG